MHPDVGPNHYARGCLLREQGRYDLAADEFRAAMAADSTDPFSAAMLSLTLGDLGNAPEAFSAAQEAVRRGPDEPFAFIALGYAFCVCEKLDAAIRAAREALRINPQYCDAFVLLAQLDQAFDNWPSALRHADEALGINPMETRAATIRGEALIKLGRSNEASESLRMALHFAPESSEFHNVLGWAYLNAGEDRDAFRHLREALRLDPLSDQSRQRLAETLKSRNIVYRSILRMTLWFGRRRLLNRAAAMALVIFYMVIVMITGTMQLLPSFWYLGLIGAGLFIWTWRRLNVPAFNLLLEFDPFGRHLLSAWERAAAWTLGLCLGVTAVSAISAAFIHYGLLVIAFANLTVVPWLLHLTFMGPPGVGRNFGMFLFSPSVVFLDLGISLAALAELGVLPEVVGIGGGLLSMVGIPFFLCGMFILPVIDPNTTALS